MTQQKPTPRTETPQDETPLAPDNYQEPVKGCPVCNEFGNYLGTLGKTPWFKCPFCGTIYSYPPPGDHARKDFKMTETPRTLNVIAREIRQTWTNVWFGAEPYLKAMAQLETPHQMYGCDTGTSVVLYFLANASTWKGEDARRIKAELKAMLK